MEKFYLTTPIYYINDQPHIGHAYTTIAADTLARYHRKLGRKVLFVTGTDEYSQKTVQAAAKAGKDTQVYTDEMAAHWQKTWDDLEIGYDRFIRTTEPSHRAAAEEIFRRLQASGDIYEDEYEGLYCVGHEAFLKPEELGDGKCPEHGTVPEKVKEKNYFFRLSRYGRPLLTHIKKHPDFIQPETRRNEIISFIEQGLDDISVSRTSRQWGIPVPGDPAQVIYVWVDALVNYLSAAGFPDKSYEQWWPADLHLMAKDIIRFHCVYWPAILMSTGIKLPKSIFAHGFFTIDGTKISKSLGNAIDPRELAATYGVEAMRFYLLKNIPFGADGDFSHARFEETYNSELADNLGNLVQRVAAMIKQYQKGVIPKPPQPMHDSRPYHDAFAAFRLDKALEEVWVIVRGLNQFIDGEKPWELAKSRLSADKEQLAAVLAHAVADLFQVADLLEPFMPQTAAKIRQIYKGPEVDLRLGVLFPKKAPDITKASF